jgi:hypothetical protein
MKFEILYVIEIRVFPYLQPWEKDWHAPCSISFLRERETRRLWGKLEAEKD